MPRHADVVEEDLTMTPQSVTATTEPDVEYDESNSVSEPSVDVATSTAMEVDSDETSDGTDEGDGQTGADVAAGRRPPHRVVLSASILILAALGTLTGWLWLRECHFQRTADQRAEFLEVGRQGAINLTTIDWEHADADVRRILDSATGKFHDDFSRRSQPFIDIVKQAKSKSAGTVVAAGLESTSNDAAQVLVAVTVKTINAEAQDQAPRSWRMRIDVQKTANEMKVSNVEFVP